MSATRDKGPTSAGVGIRRILAGIALALAAGVTAACGSADGHEALPGAGTSAEVPDDPAASSLGPPPFKTEEVLQALSEDPSKPCSSCHDPKEPPNTQRRELTMAHDTIVLRHDEKHRWCLDCHDAANRDVLHLANGTTVKFEESYRLCGQCHGDKYRDWRAGVHGRRTGQWKWNGEKKYLLCVHCHDSHAPHFQPKEPLPPPLRPDGRKAEPGQPAPHGKDKP